MTGLLRDSIDFFVLFFRSVASEDTQKSQEYSDSAQQKKTFYVWGCLLYVLSCLAIGLLSGRLGWSSTTPILISVGEFLLILVVSGIISVIVAPLVVIAIAIIGISSDVLFIEPLAWTLERPQLDRLIKLISLSFVIIGFHFDLLAS